HVPDFPVPWLRRIAINAARNHRNKCGRQNRRRVHFHDFLLADTAEEPLVVLLGEEKAEALNAALANLAAEGMMVVTARAIDEHSFVVLAEVTGLSYRAARGLYRRAVASLRKSLKHLLE